jgi:hypothetical protein
MPGQRGNRSSRPAKEDRLAVARRVMIVVVLLALIVVVVLIVSHRKSASNATAPGSTPSTAQIATGPGAHGQKLVAVPLSTALSLAKVSQESQRGHDATFSATYSSTNVPGAPPIVKLEQMPPDQLLQSGTAEQITRDGDVYYCGLGKSPVCQSESETASPYGRIIGLYAASSYDATLSTMGNLLHTGVVYDFASFQSSIAGQKSDCLSWSHEHSKVNYCVTPAGVLTEFTISANGSSLVTFAIRLTRYSAHVAPGDFQLPKAATVSNPGPKSITATTAVAKTAKAKTSKRK